MRSSSKHNKKIQVIRKKANKNTIKKRKKLSQKRGGARSTRRSARPTTKVSRTVTPGTRQTLGTISKKGKKGNKTLNIINSVVSQAKKKYGDNWEVSEGSKIPRGMMFITSQNMPKQYAYVTEKEDNCSMPINGKYPIRCRQPLQHSNAPGTPFPQNFIKDIASNPDLVIGSEM